MDVQELIKRGYRALGLGADDDVLAVFDQLGDEPSQWVVYELGAFGGRHLAGEVVAMELFGGLPAHFEVIGADPQIWTPMKHGTRLMVAGHFRVRTRGSWEVLALPFSHLWDIAGDRVERVTSVLDGVELRRLAPARAAGRRG